MSPDSYGPDQLAEDLGFVSRETLAALEDYAQLLRKWTPRINLVSPESLTDLWRRHFLDSAQLFPYLPEVPRGRDRVLVDLGSGAGFPGLVLALLGAGTVHLVESDQRKAVFLREAARLTGCDVTVHNGRLEALAPLNADVITARAFAPLPRLLPLARPQLAAQGCLLLLKGRSADEELTEAAKKWKMAVERFPSLSSDEGQLLRLSLLPIGD